MPPQASTIEGLLRQLEVKAKNIYTLKGKILESHALQMREILSSNENHFIIAPPGSGKTTAVIELAHGYNEQPPIKTVLAVPLVMIAVQKEKEFIDKGFKNIAKVIGLSKKITGAIKPTSQKKIELFFNSENPKNIIICVYDSIGKIIENAGDRISEYTLVIDEGHQLTNSCNFRLNAVNGLDNASKAFKKTIYMTGTPEGIVHLNDPVQTTIFSTPSPRKKLKINVVNYKSTSTKEKHLHLYELYKLFELTKNLAGKRVVLLDSRNTLLHLEAFIESHFKKKVVVLSSHDRDSEESEHIINEKTIPDDIDYVLTTRVISDGADIINKDIFAIFIVNVTDLLIKRQFLGRLRNQNFQIYDLVESLPEAQTIIDYNRKCAQYESSLIGRNYGIVSGSNSSRQNTIGLLHKIKLDNRSDRLLKLIATNFALEDVNMFLSTNFDGLKRYYKKFTDYNVDKYTVNDIEQQMNYYDFVQYLDADFSIADENKEWYKESLASLILYVNADKKFKDYKDLLFAQRDILGTELDYDSFEKQHELLIKKHYKSNRDGRLKQKATRYCEIFPSILDLFKEGWPYPLLQEIFVYGLGELSEYRFTKLVNLIDIYFYYKIYADFEQFRYLADISSEMKVIKKICEELNITGIYKPAYLNSFVKVDGKYPLKEYATDAIFVKEESSIKGRAHVWLSELHTLESLLKSNGVKISSEINWDSLEKRTNIFRLVRLLRKLEKDLNGKGQEDLLLRISQDKEVYLRLLHWEIPWGLI